MPEVHCKVSNCTYWHEGNRCAADQILVNIDNYLSNEHKEMNYSNELYTSNGGDTCFGTSSETCCQTFKPKCES